MALSDYLASLPPGFVPADLLSEVDTRQNPAGSRLFVTAVALREPRRAREIWTDEVVTRRSPITVVSVLLELKKLGVIRHVEQVEEGFQVFEGGTGEVAT